VTAAATSRSEPVSADSPSPAVDAVDVRFAYPAALLKRARKQKPKRGGRQALDGVSLQVAPGESVALLGPNGSGKSTLLKILATMLRADSGTVRIFGESSPATVRQSLGVVFQSPGLDAQMTVAENLLDSARLYGMSKANARRAIDDALRHVELYERRHDRVKILSGGLARRADLCRALLHQPMLLLLDEPTTGLDPTARSSFLQLIEQRRDATDLTVLMTTHLTDEAERFDRVLLMHEGRIVANDTPANLQQRAGAARLTVHDAKWSPPDADRESWQRHAGGWRLIISDESADMQRRAAQLAEQRVAYTFAPPTLADVFELLTGASLDDQSA